MSKIDDDYTNGLIDFDEWVEKKNIEKGYVFCQSCTEKHGGDWNVYHHPDHLCKGYKKADE